MKSAGICGTDLDIIRNARSDKAAILGHEGIAVVKAVGKDVTDYKINEKVVFNPVNPENQSDILGHSRDGIFQRYYKYSVEDENGSLIHKICATTDDKYGALIEPIGTAIYGHSLVDSVVKQRTVVVVGAGPIGLINAILMKSKGNKVIIVNRSEARLRLGVEYGIINKANVVLDSRDLPRVLNKRFGKIDAVYLCTNRDGALDALEKAIEYVKEKGCIDLVGGIQDGDKLKSIEFSDLNKIRRKNVCFRGCRQYVPLVRVNNGKLIHITGHRGTAAKHLDGAIGLLKVRDVEFRKIITDEIDFAEAPRVISKILADRLNGLYIKGAINFNSLSDNHG